MNDSRTLAALAASRVQDYMMKQLCPFPLREASR
jgi:hypothetical protein